MVLEGVWQWLWCQRWVLWPLRESGDPSRPHWSVGPGHKKKFMIVLLNIFLPWEIYGYLYRMILENAQIE